VSESVESKVKTPWWVWLIIAVLSCLQPAAHLLIQYAPPEGMTPTGIHIRDSATFLQSMDMFENAGSDAPYETKLGESDFTFWKQFALPMLWFYGIQGAAVHSFTANNFLAYGFFNGLFTALFLVVVYRFLRIAVGKSAPFAFALFTLGGGLGGVLFFVTGALGLHSAAGFEDHFWRFGVYELFEGAHLFPVTYYARSYYTLSLACCLGGLTTLMRAFQIRCGGHALLAAIILFPGAFLNARFGVFTLGIAALYIMAQPSPHRRSHIVLSLMFFVSGIAAWATSWMHMAMSPTIIPNLLDVGDMNMHFSPFVVAAILFLPPCLYETWRQARHMTRPWRALASAGFGYLAAFACLFLVYQTYYGNLLIARDSAVAVAISDWALIGGVAGLLWGLRMPSPEAPGKNPWIAIWFLGFFALAISAFGHGWFLRFGPQRLMVMLFLPMCILTAEGLQAWTTTRPRFARAYTGAIIGCGIITIAASTFWFQGSFGQAPGKTVYAETRPFFMTENDVQLIGLVPQNSAGRYSSVKLLTVLAPPPASDIVAMRRGNPVLFGIGSFNMSNQPYRETRSATEHFFAPGTSATDRLQILSDWDVRVVYCSETWPVDSQTLDELDRMPDLELLERAGDGALYIVTWPKGRPAPRRK
jgi:hypothetical protein